MFLELAEEARTIVLVDGQSVDMRDARPQRTGWTRPVFVTEIMNSPPMLKDSVLVTTGTSTEVIPNTDLRRWSEPVNWSGPVGQLVSSGGRGVMVDRLDLVGPYNSTDQSVFPGLDVDQAKHVPSNRRHPGAMMYQNQPVADGPAGPDRTRRPVGTDGTHALHDVDRPMAGGPVGPVFNSDPLGPSRMSSLDELHQPLTVALLDTDGIHAVDAPDWPTASGPVDRLLSIDPMGPSGMLLLDVYNQPPAVGPVGKPSIPGPMGHPGSEPDRGQTIQPRSESESSTDVPDPVIQTGSDVQTDRVNIGTVNGQTGSCDTPPSSDSGVHSLEEQWENMSTDSLDMKSEQTKGDPGQLGSETSRPLNMETAVRFDYAETDCVLGKKPVKMSLLNRQSEDRGVGINMWTIHEREHEMVYSDDRNSDIADMSDFSDDETETHVEFQQGPRTGSDRDGSVEDTSNLCDKPTDNMVTICVNENDIVNSGSDDRDSDIANMSDFSDDEDEVQEESRSETQTGCDQSSSFEETLNLCDRPTDNMRTICVNMTCVNMTWCNQRPMIGIRTSRTCLIFLTVMTKHNRKSARGHGREVIGVIQSE